MGSFRGDGGVNFWGNVPSAGSPHIQYVRVFAQFLSIVV